MKFVQRNLNESAEASAGKGSQLKELVKLSFIALIVIIVLYFFIAVAVDVAVANISVETEKTLFADFKPTGPGKRDSENPDPKVELAQQILEKLVQDPEVPPLNYQVFIIKNEKPNAMAFPGGPIGVTSGLLKVLDEKISLAFVLGHELGHFKNRDHLRGLGRGIATGIVFAILFGDSLGGDFIAGNISQFMNKAYSRDQENKADEFGLRLIMKHYGKSDGAEKLFEIISKNDKIPRWGYMFATHPDTRERIKHLKKYAEKYLSEQQAGDK